MADTRKDKRAPMSLKVRFKSATVDEFIEQNSNNMSRGGVFIRSKTPMAVGTLLKFELKLKDESPLIHGVGRVVWKREPRDDGDDTAPGMGIKFIKMDPESRALVERIVSKRGDERGDYETGVQELADRSADAVANERKGNADEAGAKKATLEGIGPANAGAGEDDFLESALTQATVKGNVKAKVKANVTATGEETGADRSLELERTLFGDEAEADDDPKSARRDAKPESEGSKGEVAKATFSKPPGSASSSVDISAITGDRRRMIVPIALAAVAVLAVSYGIFQTLGTQPVARIPETAEPIAKRATAALNQPGMGAGTLEVAKTAKTAAPAEVEVLKAPAVPAINADGGALQAATTTETAAAELAKSKAAAALPTEAKVAAAPPTTGTQSATKASTSTPPDVKAAEAVTPAPPARIMMAVEVIPKSATIRIDGAEKGTGKASIEAGVGDSLKIVAAAYGYKAATQTITAREDMKPVRITLESLPYRVTVASDPAGARVFMQGKGHETPSTVALSPLTKPITLSFRKNGFIRKDVTIGPDVFRESGGVMAHSVSVKLDAEPEAAKPAPAPKPAARPKRKPAASPSDPLPDNPF